MRRWITVFATVVIVIVLLIVIRTQGFVSGYEFSPTHFQQRRFSFYEIPLIHLQITPIRRSSATPATATYVRQNALITPHTGVPTVWHLVSLSRGLTGATPADANLLLDQLELSSGKDYWTDWSKKHPKRAKVLWPYVQRLAERELYLLLPSIFELAQLDPHSPQQLQDSIDEYLRREYALLIEDMRSADRDDLADQLLAEALQDYPDDPGLVQLDQSK
ncbi:MAG: hypothetical protein ACR2NZ_16520 [Rubripirellula sp.]